MSESVAQVLHEFGHRLGLAELSFDDDMHCELSFDALHVHVQWLESPGQVLLYAPLATMDPQTHASLAGELLDANHLYRSTLGATLSWDQASGRCQLQRLLDEASLDTDHFEACVTALVNVADYWVQRLQEFQSAGQTPVASAVLLNHP